MDRRKFLDISYKVGVAAGTGPILKMISGKSIVPSISDLVNNVFAEDSGKKNMDLSSPEEAIKSYIMQLGTEFNFNNARNCLHPYCKDQFDDNLKNAVEKSGSPQKLIDNLKKEVLFPIYRNKIRLFFVDYSEKNDLGVGIKFYEAMVDNPENKNDLKSSGIFGTVKVKEMYLVIPGWCGKEGK